jgi:hypothetical protein
VGGGVEAELAVGGEAFAGHGDEDRNVGVVVVVHGDTGLGGVGAEESADVLDDPAFGRHGEGEHEGVEAGEVEAFAEVAARGQRNDTVVVVDPFGEGVERGAGVSAVPAADVGRAPGSGVVDGRARRYLGRSDRCGPGRR